MGIQNSSLKMAVEYLAWRCVRNGEWDLAIEILDICPGTEVEKMCICINSELSVTEKNALHKKAGLPTVEECGKIVLDPQHNLDALKTVEYHLLSNNIKTGLDFGLSFMKSALLEPKWNLKCLWTLLRIMSCVSSQLLQDISFDRHRFELQVYSAYIGALIAIRQKFTPVIVPLFTTTVSLIRRVHNANLSINEDFVSSEMHAWVVFNNSDSKQSESDRIIYEELIARTSQDPPFGDVGVTIISGSNLPRHSDHHRCYLKGSAIQGPVYFLDDSKSAVSINDALMWAKVNRFSPLKTGFTINPF